MGWPSCVARRCACSITPVLGLEARRRNGNGDHQRARGDTGLPRGGTASITTAWITQRFQSRREFARSEGQKKEALYAEFIAETAKLLIDSLDHILDRPEALIQVYALINRIRLNSSDAVVAAAEQAMQRIVQRYAAPNLSPEEIRALAASDKRDADPLKAFSEACRAELKALAYA